MAARLWVYPTWQFLDDGTPLPGLRDVLAIFAQNLIDGWEVAGWLESTFKQLGGASPRQQLLAGGDASALVASAHPPTTGPKPGLLVNVGLTDRNQLAAERPSQPRRPAPRSSTLPGMAFSEDQLRLIDKSREVEIETRAGDRRYRTVIWVVVDEGEVFVRSVRGTAGKWYQRALANPEVALRVGHTTIASRAVPATDPVSIERTSEALRRKYRGRSRDAMLVPEVLDTTVRLDPT